MAAFLVGKIMSVHTMNILTYPLTLASFSHILKETIRCLRSIVAFKITGAKEASSTAPSGIPLHDMISFPVSNPRMMVSS